MKNSAIVWIVVAAAVVLGGWYWFSMSRTSPEQTTAAQSAAGTPPTSATPVLSVRSDPAFGTYLVAMNGMTLYIDTKDSAGVSTCAGVCLANWPAYTVSPGAALAGGEGVSGMIGTIKGTTQVTYKGMPLYFWIKDTKPGDATGNGVGNFVFAKP